MPLAALIVLIVSGILVVCVRTCVFLHVTFCPRHFEQVELIVIVIIFVTPLVSPFFSAW